MSEKIEYVCDITWENIGTVNGHLTGDGVGGNLNVFMLGEVRVVGEI